MSVVWEIVVEHDLKLSRQMFVQSPDRQLPKHVNDHTQNSEYVQATNDSKNILRSKKLAPQETWHSCES